MCGACRYFTHIVERSDPELLVLETDRCLFDDPAFKCAPLGSVHYHAVHALDDQHVCSARSVAQQLPAGFACALTCLKRMRKHPG